MRFYYFGCIDQPGHQMWSPETPQNLLERRALSDLVRTNPWGLRIDTCLCPGGGVQGQAMLHHRAGWTALSFWDRSVDHRPGSNSTFLAEGLYSFEQMIEMAKSYFPQVMGRLTFDLVHSVGWQAG